MKERQVFNFSEREPRSRGIQVKDNLGIKTKEGLVDIQVDTPLLEADILATVECQSPQFLKKAVDFLDKLVFYFGKRSFVDVALEEAATRGEIDEEKLKTWRILLQAREFVLLGSSLGTFLADEKCPFFYFDTPRIVKKFGQEDFPKKLKEFWFHERQHFVDFLDPVRHEQFIQDQKERFILFGIIEGGAGVIYTVVGGHFFITEAKGKKITRRTFLKAVLGGVVMGGTAAVAFSPASMMISNELTYWRGHAGEKRARQAAEEGKLIRPFEDIFQIRFYPEP